MSQQGWKFFTRFDMMSGADMLFVRYIDYQGKRFAVAPLALKEVPQGVPYDAATLGYGDLNSEGTPNDANGFLQAALDAAWEAGLRPKGVADPTNELTAVRYHLEDMRTLAKLPAKGAR